jgi:hypothetical protein
MPRFSFTTFHLPHFGRLGRRTPKTPTCKSIEPTNCDSGLHSPISILNDDVLLNIFILYGLNFYIGEGDPIRDTYTYIWKCHWWYHLAQVSRRWRYIIFASPRELDLRLICTQSVPVAEMLAHSPPLPLVVSYDDTFHKVTTEDEEGILLALSHRDRVRRIVLCFSPSSLERLISAMDGEFPILECLVIKPQIKGHPKRASLMLPINFQGPKLHSIHFDGVQVALPMRFPLLTSSLGGLVYLWLEGITQPAYLPPNDIHTQLSYMPQLWKLGIMFESECPGHNVVDSSPIMTPVTLPNLRSFSFKGGSAYLESLLAGISAPVLTNVGIDYFHEIELPVPRLLQFIQSSMFLTFKTFKLGFWGEYSDWGNYGYFVADPQLVSREYLYVKISCSHLDSQVASAVQIINTLSPLLSVVEGLYLVYTESRRPLPAVLPVDRIDRIQWREILRSFSGVRTLHVKEELVRVISQSLRSEDGESPLELLPNLERLTYSGSEITDMFAPFTKQRRAAGHLVTVRLESE